MKLFFSFLLFSYPIIFSIWSVQCKVSYSEYSLLQITPTTEKQLKYLLKINSNTSAGIDFWLRTTAVNKSADVMVSPSAKELFLGDLDNQEIPYKFLIEDIGKILEEDIVTPPDFSKDNLIAFFNRYNRYSEILKFVSILSETYPEFVTALEIGRSYEDRPLMLIKISSSTLGNLNKPAIWIQGGAHAREQIGPASVCYFALQLVTGYLQDYSVSSIVNAFDWYLLPVLNPDGYEYSHTTDRLWRKTRSISRIKPNCIGVDANRNWDLSWSDAAGSSKDPCSHNYAGPRAFSEPETRSVSNFMLKRLKQRLLLFLDVHSYSQRWMTPWGYTSRLPPNYKAQKQLAEVATSALEAVHGTKYSVGTSANSLYTVSGGARDWVYGVVGAEYSYVVELRDKGNYGFVLNSAQILPTVEETWAGVQAMATELSKRQSIPAILQFSGDLKNSTKGFAYGIAVFWRF